MKSLIMLLILNSLCVSLGHAQDTFDSKWKVDLSNLKNRDQFWPEERAVASPVAMNSPEMDLNLKDISHLQSYDKKGFKELMAKYSDYENNRVYISLDGADKSVLSLAAAASLGLIVLKGDDDLMDIVQKNKNEDSKKLAAFGYEMGRKEGLLPIVAGAYFLGVIFDNGKLKDIGIISVGAQFAAQMVVEMMKVSFERARPREGVGAYAFNVDGGKSFISGHAAGAFSLATLLTEVYGEQYPIIPYVTYGVAAITAWSRMHDDGHWGSDVILGAVAGHIITRIVYRLYRAGDIPESERNLYIVPYVDHSIDGVGPFTRQRDEIGLKLKFTFSRPAPASRPGK
jgi:membrane-associated phospholipid phosphatase